MIGSTRLQVSRTMLWLCAVLVLAGGSPVWAGDPGSETDMNESAALRAEIQALSQQLSKVQQRLATVEAQQGAATYEAPAGGAAMVTLPSGVQGIELSGFVDTAYTYNFDEANNRLSGFRVFDTRANSFMLNNAELVVQKPVSAEHPVGFRMDIDFGTDSEVVGSVTTGLGTGDDEVDLQQGYVEYLAPVGNGIDVKFGKFVTLHGAEVIEAKDNWNYSRSYLFGFAIPFTHTGIRVSYPWTEWLLTCFGVNNGWDVVDDNNKAKTVEFSTTLTPLEKLSLTGTYMVGAEQTGDDHDQRHLIDFVAQYQPLDKLTLKLNFDYGREEDVVSETGNGSATWNGVAAYAKYDLTDKWSLAGRYEVFNDQDGVRTAVNTVAGSPTGSAIEGGLQLSEFTLTSEYKLHEHLITRLEYRHDKADSDVFRHDQGFSDTQDTIAMEFIAPF